MDLPALHRKAALGYSGHRRPAAADHMEAILDCSALAGVDHMEETLDCFGLAGVVDHMEETLDCFGLVGADHTGAIPDYFGLAGVVDHMEETPDYFVQAEVPAHTEEIPDCSVLAGVVGRMLAAERNTAWERPALAPGEQEAEVPARTSAESQGLERAADLGSAVPTRLDRMT